MDVSSGGLSDTKALYRSIDQLLGSVDRAQALEEMVNRMVELFIAESSIPIEGARIWERRGERYVLYFQRVDQEKIPVGHAIPAETPTLKRVEERGSVFLTPEDEEYDHPLEESLGVVNYAAVSVGPGRRYVISFDVEWTEFSDREEFMFFLDIVRQVVNAKLNAERVEGVLREARAIQLSILPAEMPEFEGYDLFGVSIPVEGEQVGGDMFGCTLTQDHQLTVFVGDATGHGLPAALMARDLHTAIHMGLISDVKLTRLVERINRIFCENTPHGKYMTLFYGEIDHLHQLVYCSAGHPSLILSGDEFIELRKGGPILGVKPDTRYSRGVRSLEPGDLLCLYTDGVTETFDRSGEMYGEDRVRAYLRKHRDATSKEIAEGLLAEVEAFGDHRDDDDRTVLIVKRDQAAART